MLHITQKSLTLQLLVLKKCLKGRATSSRTSLRMRHFVHGNILHVLVLSQNMALIVCFVVVCLFVVDFCCVFLCFLYGEGDPFLTYALYL